MDIDPLTSLTIQLSASEQAPSSRLEIICRSVASVLPKANRISLWKFDNDYQQMQGIFQLVDGQVRQCNDMRLHQQQFPAYFDALLRHQTVNAPDARHHPVTQCFSEHHFKPNDVYSQLAYTFHQNFTPFGVICCEATGAPVEWQQRDVALLKRVAGIISMFYPLRG